MDELPLQSGERTAHPAAVSAIPLDYLAQAELVEVPLPGTTLRVACGVIAIVALAGAGGQVFQLLHAEGSLRIEALSFWSNSVEEDGVAGTIVAIAAVALRSVGAIPLVVIALRGSAMRVERSHGLRVAVWLAGLLLTASTACADGCELATKLQTGGGRAWNETLGIAAVWPADASFGALLVLAAISTRRTASRFVPRGIAILLVCMVISFVAPMGYWRLMLTMWVVVFGDNGPSGWSEIVMHAAGYSSYVIAALSLAAVMTLWWRLRGWRWVTTSACLMMSWQPALEVVLWLRECVFAFTGGGISEQETSAAIVFAGVQQWLLPMNTMAFCFTVIAWAWRNRKPAQPRHAYDGGRGVLIASMPKCR